MKWRWYAPARAAIQNMYRPFDFAWFSTGFQVVAFLHSLRDSCRISFERDDIFGMSFIQENGEEHFPDALYYYNTTGQTNAYADHSLPRERDAFTLLFGLT
ncbi:MAG: hypothetical protein LBR94_06785 [Desulfovibrio sp.]|jgi:hypothetical protein|nr:hypothetical protein [Desulfovibrio sp.]